MKKKEFQFSFEQYDSIDALNPDDAVLLNEARKVIVQAYAPYSRFRVGAAAKLVNGEIITGTNQENASFPAGICAERVLLSAASSFYPDVAIETLAISYANDLGESNHPVSPCGICRQSLQEYSQRMSRPIRLILAGMKGEVLIISDANLLLPLAFSAEELK